MINTTNNASELNKKELGRYARHLSLPEIGLSGQKRLKSSSVLCIGSGGLGSPLLIYLAAAGVGRIGIVDFDLVESSNLQRQVIHGEQWIGKSKTNSARSRILEINPFCKIDIFETLLTQDNGLKIIEQFDLICDCTDNFTSRYLINDACVILNKPNIYGSIAGFQGQATVFNLTPESPNLRDLMPSPPPEELIPSCSEGGVLGVLPGIIGLIQATEVIKIITGAGITLDKRLLIFDALHMKFKELTLKKQSNTSNTLDILNSFNQTKSEDKSMLIKSISIKDLKIALNQNPEHSIIIDVRKENEHKSNSIDGAKLIPLDDIKNGLCIKELKLISKNKLIYVYCQSGQRSAIAISELSKYKISAINISGGFNAWKSEQEKA